MSLPPKDVPSQRLFRLLTMVPRPIIPIDYKIEGIDLFVVGLRGAERAEAYDVDTKFKNAHVDMIASNLVSASLHTDDGHANFDPMQLHNREFTLLSSHVLKALNIISPSFAASDTMAWHLALKDGARYNINSSEVRKMAMSGGRADRYFGMPLIQLTDGQLMAYDAALELVRELTGGESKQAVKSDIRQTTQSVSRAGAGVLRSR